MTRRVRDYRAVLILVTASLAVLPFMLMIPQPPF